MIKTLCWIVLCLFCAVTVLYWNATQLIGADPKPRMKDLEFVPDAQVLRVMSVGHTNTSAKLRWIDAFSYLQLQFEKRDDTLIGNSKEGGFDRLYGALIDLDPKFEPFYEFAIMSEALLDDRTGTLALRSAQRGCMELPHSMSMWRNLAAHVKSMNSHNPLMLDGILSRWAEMAPDDKERYHIQRWKSQLGILDLQGLAQLDYWAAQLVTAKPKTPLADIAAESLRQQLNRYCMQVLQDVYDAAADQQSSINACLQPQPWRQLYGNGAQLKFENAMLIWGPLQVPMSVASQIEENIHARKKYSLVSLSQIQLRNDPYGYPYTVSDGNIVSPGRERFMFKRKMASWTVMIQNLAIERQRWPADLDEAHAWLSWPSLEAPAGGVVSWYNNSFHVDFADEKDAQPWPLRDMAVYWLDLVGR